MTLAEDRVLIEDDWEKGIRITNFLYAALLQFPRQQAAVLHLVEEIRSLPELDLTQEQKARLGETWQEWYDMTEFENTCKSAAREVIGFSTPFVKIFTNFSHSSRMGIWSTLLISSLESCPPCFISNCMYTSQG